MDGIVIDHLEKSSIWRKRRNSPFETKIDETVRYVEMNETTYGLAQDIIDDGLAEIEGQTILADTGAKKLITLSVI